MKKVLFVIFLLQISFFLANPARGEGQDTLLQARDAWIDLPVPSSPTFLLIGVTPSLGYRPSTIREFSISFTNANNYNGYALDIAPYAILKGRNLKIQDYNKFHHQILSRTQISLGTIQEGGFWWKYSHIGFGFRIALIDRGDPRLDEILVNEIASLIDKTLEQPTPVPDNSGNGEGVIIAGLRDKIDYLRAKSQKRNWNKTRVEIAGAFGGAAPEFRLNDFEIDGLSTWLTGAVGIGGWGQLVAHARYFNPDDSFNETYFYGGRFLAGSSTLNGYLELIGISERYDNYSRWSSGLEIRLVENLWAELSFGTGLGDNTEIHSIANLRWGFLPQPKYGRL
jgi:hypothetical protein